ncbi:hypothetical protein M2133_003129 [Parabacteroides sp. PF5-6]|nr:hypothetical protein [Parabacteroides sp. PF5-6]
MKKVSLYLLSLLIMTGFSACDEDFNKDIAAPQGYEPEAAQDVNYQIANLGATFDLNTITDNTFGILKEASFPQFPEGSTVNYELQLSKTEDFTDKSVIKAELSGGNYHVAKADMQSVIVKVYNRKPTARDFYSRVVAVVETSDKQAVNIRSNALTFAVTPEALPIEPAYYLIGDMNGWNPDNLTPFNHSGNDVYEDPHFTVLIQTTGATYFKIAPESAKEAHIAGGEFWGAVIGTAVDGDASLEGSIVVENAQAIKIEAIGYVKISLNMEEYTYKIEPLGDISPYLYVPGNHQSWTPATAPTLYSAKMDLVYDGFVYLDGEYKFTSAPDWDHTNYGSGGEGKLSTDGGAGNLNAAAGFYYLKADLGLLTYQQTKTEWGLIGDATPGGWDSSTPMIYDKGSNSWTLTTTLTGGKEFKFRANDSWDLNMGGTPTKLVLDGGNIKVAETGTYTITLKLSNADAGNTFTLTKK